jgi:WD40 repeat protein
MLLLPLPSVRMEKSWLQVATTAESFYGILPQDSRSKIHYPLASTTLTLFDLAFSPDGKILASADSVSSITLWDMETRRPIGEVLANSLGGGVTGQTIAFSPDGNTLVSAHSSFSDLVIWDINPQSWIEKTCQRVGRNFTRMEWAKYFPRDEYRVTCPQWPLEPEPTMTP